MKLIFVAACAAFLLLETTNSSESEPISLANAYALVAPSMPPVDSFICEYHFASRNRFDVVFKENQSDDQEGEGWSIQVSSARKVRRSSQLDDYHHKGPSKSTKSHQQAISASMVYLDERGLLKLPCIIRITTIKNGGAVVNFERLPSLPGGWLECEVSTSAKVLHLRRGQ